MIITSKNGFTMAEVLITLGIIGIVAAMTLPALVQKYQNYIVENRMKKFYSIINQAVMRAKLDFGDYEGWSYWVPEEVDENGNNINKSDASRISFRMYLKPYMNVIAEKEVVDGDGNKRFLYELADGSAFAYQAMQNREIVFYPNNAEKCIKLPKAEGFGVCAFAFQFYPLSKEKSWKYLYQKGVEPYLHNWDGNVETLYSGDFTPVQVLFQITVPQLLSRTVGKFRKIIQEE